MQTLHVSPQTGETRSSVTEVQGNNWRRWRYSFLAPFYDLGAAGHEAARRRAVDLLALAPGERVLVVGVGTGQDLAFLPRNVQVTAVDLSPAMLLRARRRHPDAELLVMEGERLDFPAGAFDAVLLHQVLEVAARPEVLLREAARVQVVGGRITVFDKFVPTDHRLAPWRSALRRGLDVCFTTTKLVFEDLLRSTAAPLEIADDETCGRGPFRLVVLRRRAGLVPRASDAGALEAAPRALALDSLKGDNR
jgi:ubiquinone/menaquinone biosynthesis C-methylase UbiE